MEPSLLPLYFITTLSHIAKDVPELLTFLPQSLPSVGIPGLNLGSRRLEQRRGCSVGVCHVTYSV